MKSIFIIAILLLVFVRVNAVILTSDEVNYVNAQGNTTAVTMINAANSFNGSFAGSGNFDISTNLIPAGATYDVAGRYYILGSDGYNPSSFILQTGGTYLLTFGTNEYLAHNTSVPGIYYAANGPVLFTWPGSYAYGEFYLAIGTAGNPVTATLCYIIHTNNLPGLLPQLSTGLGSNLTNAAGNGFVDYTITNGLASTNFVNTTVQAATNGLTGGGVTLSGVTNVVVSFTNNLATTNFVNTATNGFVTATVTNGLATTNYVNTATNGHVTASITNGLATTNWVISYADTNGAGIAAAQIATNNFGNTVPVNMTNSANRFTGNFTGTFGALVSSSSVTVNTNTIYTYGPGLGSGFFFIENNTDCPYTNAFNNSYVCKYGSAYYITNVSGMYKSYYSGTISATNSSGYSSTNWVNSSGGTINFIPNGGSIYPAGTYFPSTTNITTVGNGSGITNIPTSGISNFLGAVTNVAAALTNGLATTNYVNVATNGFVTASVTNGLATTNYVNTATNGLVTATVTNGLATTNFALVTATNVAAALTNQLVIPKTNGLASTNFVNAAITNLPLAQNNPSSNGLISGQDLARAQKSGWPNQPPMRFLATWSLNQLLCSSNLLKWATNMVNNNYLQHGWNGIDIQEYWMGGHDINGLFYGNTNFPEGMPYIITNLQSMGFKVGLAFTLGPSDNSGYAGGGSMGYYVQDATNAANMGVDFVELTDDTGGYPEYVAYQVFINALKSTGKNIPVFGSTKTWNSGDTNNNVDFAFIMDEFPMGQNMVYPGFIDGWTYPQTYSMQTNFYYWNQQKWRIRPGHYLIHGSLSAGIDATANFNINVTKSEYGMAAMFHEPFDYFSPYYAGSDTNYGYCMVTNDWLGAIQADPGTIPPSLAVGTNILDPVAIQVWTNQLTGVAGRMGICVWNPNTNSVSGSTNFTITITNTLGLPSGYYVLSDVWAYTQTLVTTNGWSVSLPPEGCGLYTLDPAPWSAVPALNNLAISNNVSTNGLASTNYVLTQGTNIALAMATNVVNALTNGLATTNYVNTATNNSWNTASNAIQSSTNTLSLTGISATTGTNIANSIVQAATNNLSLTGISATAATNIVVFILTNSPSIPADSVTNCGQSSVSISTNCLSWTGNGPNGKADGQGCATNVSVALDSGAGSHAGYFLIHNTGTPTTLQTTNWGTLTFGVIYPRPPTVCSYPGWATNAGAYLTAWWPKDVTTSNCLVCASPSATLPAANDSGRYAYLIVP